MSDVKTVFELRELSKVDGHADFVRTQHFHELEDEQAKGAYRAAAARAPFVLGKEQTFTTHAGNEVTGVVARHVVELMAFKTQEGRRWGGKVVDQSNEFDSPGLRLVLEVERKTTPAPTEAVSEPANT